MAAAEKLDDAAEADDTSGVDMALVARAQAALGRGDTHAARALLERSIGARPHLEREDPRPIGEVTRLATGTETGIDVVTDPLAPHRRLTGGDWAAATGLVALGAAGVFSARRLRPHTPSAA